MYEATREGLVDIRLLIIGLGDIYDRYHISQLEDGKWKLTAHKRK